MKIIYYQCRHQGARAIIFTGSNHSEVAKWMQSQNFYDYGTPETGDSGDRFQINRTEGAPRVAEPGDYIALIDFEFVPIKPTLFAEQYFTH